MTDFDMTLVDAATHGHCTTIWSENVSKDLTAGRLTLTLLRICLPGPSLSHCQTDSLTSVTWLHSARLWAPLVDIRPSRHPHGVRFGQAEQIFNAFSVPPCTTEQTMVLRCGGKHTSWPSLRSWTTWITYISYFTTDGRLWEKAPLLWLRLWAPSLSQKCPWDVATPWFDLLELTKRELGHTGIFPSTQMRN